MGTAYPEILPELRAFIEAQPVFFVATAPLAQSGHVNVSPKGLDSLRVLSPHRVAYLDIMGSGNETSAHLLENGRITFLFCAFSGPPRVLRLYGQGRTVLSSSPEWRDLKALFPDFPAIRQIIIADIDCAKVSCGSGVPLMEYTGQRQALVNWGNQFDSAGIAHYLRENNFKSFDGLPTPVGKDAKSGT